jgi:hypothetical protein
MLSLQQAIVKETFTHSIGAVCISKPSDYPIYQTRPAHGCAKQAGKTANPDRIGNHNTTGLGTHAQMRLPVPYGKKPLDAASFMEDEAVTSPSITRSANGRMQATRNGSGSSPPRKADRTATRKANGAYGDASLPAPGDNGSPFMNGQQNDHLNLIEHQVTASSIHTAASRFMHMTQNQVLLKHPLRNPHHPPTTYYNTDYGNYLPIDYGRSKSYKPKALYCI